MQFTFDSVVFHSNCIPELRAFYEGKLGFPTGTFEKNGEHVPDFSDSYVNYHVGGGLIGFESEGEPVGEAAAVAAGEGFEANTVSSVGSELPANSHDGADIILRVSDFSGFLERVKAAGIPIVKENRFFFMIHDPEGRTLIFEPQ